MVVVVRVHASTLMLVRVVVRFVVHPRYCTRPFHAFRCFHTRDWPTLITYFDTLPGELFDAPAHRCEYRRSSKAMCILRAFLRYGKVPVPRKRPDDRKR